MIPAMEKGGSQYTLISQELDRKQNSGDGDDLNSCRDP